MPISQEEIESIQDPNSIRNKLNYFKNCDILKSTFDYFEDLTPPLRKISKEKMIEIRENKALDLLMLSMPIRIYKCKICGIVISKDIVKENLDLFLFYHIEKHFLKGV